MVKALLRYIAIYAITVIVSSPSNSEDTNDSSWIPLSIEWPVMNSDGTYTANRPSVWNTTAMQSNEIQNLKEKAPLSEDVELIASTATRTVAVYKPSADIKSDLLMGENLLDTKISLQLTDVSAWTALKEITLNINAESNSARTLEIATTYDMAGGGAPEAFTSSKTISLTGTQIAARQLLLNVMAKSTVPFRYTYVNGSVKNIRTGAIEQKGNLAITFMRPDGKEDFLRFGQLNEEERAWWKKEFAEASARPVESPSSK